MFTVQTCVLKGEEKYEDKNKMMMISNMEIKERLGA